MSKKRILFVGEFSQLATGFSTYMGHVIPELFKTGEYEIAELATYANKYHPKLEGVPWKVYPNEPDPNNPEENKLFSQNKMNQFGLWKFHEVLLDFKPDQLISIRDPWMDSFIQQSPYRKYFKYIHMPTIDGEPQKEEWLASYKEVDTLLTYSYWAKNLLEREYNGTKKVFDVASPGTDTETFKPVDKKEARAKFGITGDIFVIQTVMRNQPRKLFPELMRSFNRYLQLCKEKGREDLVQKTFLHFHTTNPDLGWDLPTEIRNHGLAHKVLFTYMCDACGAFGPSFYQGDRTICRNCFNSSLRLPNTAIGLTRDQLAQIMQLADLYVQYSVCLTRNQQVITKNGYKNIQDILVGEEVLTHKGRYRKVLKTFNNQLGGRKVHKLSVDSNYSTLECTEDHPVFALTKANICPNTKQGVREYLGQCIRENKDLPEGQWVEAKNLQNGDMVGFTINDTVIDVNRIDLAEFAKDNAIITDTTIKVKSGDEYPRYIDVNNDFCKFLGLFAADGTTSGDQGLRVCLGLQETDNKNIAHQIFKKLSDKEPLYHPYKDRAAEDICLFSRLHNNIFAQWFKRGLNKQLPLWSNNLPTDKQKSILSGLFMGDGYYDDDRNNSVYVTTSKTLSDQVTNILRRLRLNFNLHIDYRLNSKDGKNRQPQYRFEVRGDVTSDIFDTKRLNTRGLYIDNIHWMRVKSNEIIDYKDNVFCLEVDIDNSFVCQFSNVKNCEGYGMAGNDAKACGVPTMQVDYTAMSEQAHSPGGIPIPVEKFFQESVGQTGQLRALPDNEATAQSMFEFFSASQEHRDKMGQEARDWVVKNYKWENIAKIWKRAIDSTPILDRNVTWDSPPRIIKSVQPPKPNMTNEELVRWAMIDVLAKPSMFAELGPRLIQYLNQGFEQFQLDDGRMSQRPFTRNEFVQFFMGQVQQNNMLEKSRCSIQKDKPKVQVFRV